MNQFASPSTGSVNQATGALSLAVPLTTEIFLTSNGTQPCPRCSAVGSPGNPGVGTCDRGARLGLACATTNSQGLSSDCVPGGADRSQDLGAVPITLAPLTTAGASRTSPDGVFCPQQTTNQGCFHSADCRGIFVDGLAAGALVPNTPLPVSLGSAFCIPKASSGLVNGAASLPGPGAASLPGTVTLVTSTGGGSTTSTTATSTTSVTSTTASTTTVSTSTTSTSTTSTTLLPALLPLTVEFATVAGSATIAATLSPVTTGTASLANPGGVFCPGQDPGCFGQPACRSVTETGSSPGVAINSALSPQPATLVSTFCIPGTGNVLLDGPGGLPGPAAISLPGTVRAQL